MQHWFWRMNSYKSKFLVANYNTYNIIIYNSFCLGKWILNNVWNSLWFSHVLILPTICQIGFRVSVCYNSFISLSTYCFCFCFLFLLCCLTPTPEMSPMCLSGTYCFQCVCPAPEADTHCQEPPRIGSTTWWLPPKYLSLSTK